MTGPEATERTGRNGRYGWYVTAVLTLAYMFSVMDRQILVLMVGPVERDLGLGDLDFALLSGGVFGLCYALFGLPFAWAADRFSRKWTIVLGIALWSAMTALCGLSASFGQFLAARIGVAAGEAALSPAAHSLLADHFSRARLPRAMGVYTSAVFVGSAVAFILGGFALDVMAASPGAGVSGGTAPWRRVLVAFGLAGLWVALWAATLREPPRAAARRAGAGERLALTAYLLTHRRLAMALIVGPSLAAMLSFMDGWYPELFVRNWGWSAADSGRVNGLASLLCGPLGVLAAGYGAGRLMQRGDGDACLRLAAWATLLTGGASVLMPLMPGAWAMVAMLGAIKFFMAFVPVLVPSAIQMAVPPELRARVSAAFLFGAGAIGMGCGPLVPALIGGALFGDPAKMGYALALTALVVTPLAWMGLRAGVRRGLGGSASGRADGRA